MNNRGVPYLCIASALVFFLWVEIFLVPSHRVDKQANVNGLLYFFSNFVISEMIGFIISSIIIVLCVSSFARKIDIRVRIPLVCLAIVSIFMSAYPFKDIFDFHHNDNDFVVFREATVNNQDFNKIIVWADGLLLSAGDQPQINIQVPQSSIPTEVGKVFWKQEAEPAISVSVHTEMESGRVQKFVAINYMFRDTRYGFLIGSSNLYIPIGKVQNIWKYKDGVYCFKDQ